METCLFCDIARKEKKADIVAENDEMIVFKNIRPSAPVHLLIVPKKHIESIQELPDEDAALVGRLFLEARDIAKKQNLKGYKLQFNVGRKGGQLIDHLHLHLMGGWSEVKGK